MTDRDRAQGPATQVWLRPGPLGIFQAYSAFGGVVSPILAGFALATITLLLTTDQPKQPPLWEWALAALAATAGLSIYAIQFNGTALGYAIPPGDRLSWTPEATVDAGALTKARELHAVDLKVGQVYGARAGVCYDLSVLAFLASLALLLVPGSWTFLRAVPVALTALAGVVQVWWMLAGRLLPRGSWPREVLLPSRRGLELREGDVPELNELAERAITREGPLWHPERRAKESERDG